MLRRSRKSLLQPAFFCVVIYIIVSLLRPSAPKLYSWNTIHYRTTAASLPEARGTCPGLDESSKPALVVSYVAADGDTAWLERLSSKYNLCIYNVDAPADSSVRNLRVPANRGHESITYLTFLIDNYDSIPQAGAVFVHGNRFQWHNDDPLYDNAASLAALNVASALEPTGYHNLRCDWSAGTCPKDSGPAQGSLETYINSILQPWSARSASDAAMPQAFAVLFGGDDYLKNGKSKGLRLGRSDPVRAQCCAQFVVSREAMHRHTREEYLAIRQWLLDSYGTSRNSNAAPRDDRIAGRILSYLWHVLFIPQEVGPVDLAKLNEQALRRKKCDATKPTCTACESRNITCHGYGDRPSWMNGGEEEQTQLTLIKDAVKKNSKRKRAETLQNQQEEDRAKSPAPVRDRQREEADRLPGNSDQNREILQVEVDISPSILEASSSQTPSTAPTPSVTTYFRFGFHREAELLMHYLDHVFALQFRFHSPSVASGGRGWLLWLLTETKPLYHAALSLGALHQHSLLARSVRGQRYHDTLNELNEHHNRALQELQIFLQSSYESSAGAASGRKRRLQILACGVELISFELFRGGTSQWQVHLDALATVVRSMSSTNDAVDNASAGGLTPGTPDETQSHRLEDTAENFLVGAVLWFDVLSCASTNDPPRLHAQSTNLLQGEIDLATIIGCQSWVPLIIGDIAALSAWKARAMSTSSLSFWKLFEQGNPIRGRLEVGIAGLRAEIDEAFAVLGLSHLGTTGAYLVLTNPGVQQEAIKRAITHVFAHAAQVYLNTVISGANPELDDVRNSVISTMDALQEMQFICDAQALRSLIWPICIAGSMAEDVPTQSYFQSLIQGLGDEAHNFGNSTTALQVMQKCWTSRGEKSRSWDWATAMECMGQRVLLV
ncbi:hypothetical protein E4T43_06643 [Aureobasidium subglaciale]|nr:hypothetical protein E4T43_06643 [Aureobasidium subglaciale]